MKYCLEFGVRGGAHVENQIIPTQKLAEQLARRLVMTYTNDPHASGARSNDWLFDRHCARMTWQNKTHFVAITRLDGVLRGPASAALWRSPVEDSLLNDTVVSVYDQP